MKKIIVGLLTLVLLSCSKYKQNSKFLVGEWQVDVVRIEDGEGFLFYDSLASGSLAFDGSTIDGSSSYSYSYFGQYVVSDSVLFIQNSCGLAQNGDVLIIARPTDTLKAKIIMLTKKELTFEYYDYVQFRLKRFSCSRK
jgi:hypothetical protein